MNIIFIFMILYHTSVSLELSSKNVTQIGMHDIQMNKQYCFHFSWLGPLYDEDRNINCSGTEYKNIPCIKPFEINVSPPNITDMWESVKNNSRSDITCFLRPGYSCLKYTYSFDEAILNITYFCGKMIEDTVYALDNGCFTQKIGAHIVETCACRSSYKEMPCNLSSRISYFFTLNIIILISLFTTNTFFLYK